MKTTSILHVLLVALALCTLVVAPAQAEIELADIACETTGTTGTDTLILDGAAVGGYLGLAAAGVSSGATVPYQITTGTGGSREIETGQGVFTDGDPDTLTRIAEWSTDGEGAELDLSGTSTICIGPISSIFASAPESFIVAASDEAKTIVAVADAATFRMPYAFTVTEVRCSLNVAQPSGSLFTVDINEDDTSILSTKLTFDNTETTTTTAATAVVISDSAIADDAEIEIDIDTVGGGDPAGLKCALIGHQ